MSPANPHPEQDLAEAGQLIEPVTASAWLGVTVAAGALFEPLVGVAIALLGWTLLAPPRRWANPLDHARLVAGCVVGLIVCAITIAVGRLATQHWQPERQTLHRIAAQLATYSAEHGVLPAHDSRDRWGRPHRVELLRPGVVRISALGRNGVAGGTDADSDLSETADASALDPPGRIASWRDYRKRGSFILYTTGGAFIGGMVAILMFGLGEPTAYRSRLTQAASLLIFALIIVFLAVVTHGVRWSPQAGWSTTHRSPIP